MMIYYSLVYLNMLEKLIESPLAYSNQLTETTWHINSGNFVHSILNLTQLHLRHQPTAYKVRNIIPGVLGAYNHLANRSQSEYTIPTSVVTQHNSTDAFNELLLGFNVAWQETVGSVSRSSEGLCVLSWLDRGKEQTIIDSSYYSDIKQYLEGQRLLALDHFYSQPKLNNFYSMFHEIGPTYEYLAVGNTEKGKLLGIEETNMAGIKQENGKGKYARYSIIHRQHEHKLD